MTEKRYVCVKCGRHSRVLNAEHLCSFCHEHERKMVAYLKYVERRKIRKIYRKYMGKD